MRSTAVAFCLSLAAAASPTGQQPEPGRIVTVDGEALTGQLTSIAHGEATFGMPGGSRSVPLRELWSVRLADREPLMTRPGRKVIALAGGTDQFLAVTRLSVREGKVWADTPLLGSVVIDMSAVRAAYLPRGDQLPDTCRKRHGEMKLPRSGQDYLIAQDRKGHWVPVPGVLKGVDEGAVRFEYEGSDRRVDLGAVRVIEFARMAAERSAPAGYLVGRGGSMVGFRSVSLTGTALTVEIEGMEVKSVPLEAVAELRFVSDRCVQLSQVEPSKVVQVGLFDVSFGYRRDRSTLGGPICLGGATYARGLGLHSRCELTYELEGRYARFAATAGIDDAAGRRGDATLRVLGDGKDLLQPIKLAAGAQPVSVRCDLSGLKQLTLIVDFGDDQADVGDHVCLAEARLIKP